LGRKDSQVKIRGLRIELGEIEVALTELPGIYEAAVLLHQEDAREESKQLIAYITGNQDTAPDLSNIQEALKAKLHRFMIPHRIEWLPRMPLSASGKLDHNELHRSVVPIQRDSVNEAEASHQAKVD
jgi:acyl-coenzyme A synthetase/AMP-(fatty) acid ligase